MRTKNSVINSAVSLFSYALLFFGPFFVTPALAILGENIVGIQKTFSDIVSLLSVVELGISFGIIYKLYKPIADENFKKVAVLLNFYKKAFKRKLRQQFPFSLIIIEITNFLCRRIISQKQSIIHFK